MPDQGLVWVDASGVSTALRQGTDLDINEGMMGRYGPTMAFVSERVPLKPGQRFRNIQHGTATVTVPVSFHSSTSAGLRTLLRAWAHRLDPVRGEGKLQATGPSGDVRELVCRYSDGLEAVREGYFSDVGGLAYAVLHFVAEQPYWQDIADTVQSWQLLSSLATFFPIFPLRLSGSEVFADAVVDNSAGDVEAWPVWTITGPGSSPILRNLTTTMVLSLPVTLLGGETVTIDTRPGRLTVTRGDGTSLFGSLAFPPQLWSLAQGSNSIRIELTAATSASIVQLNWRKRYLAV